jgi:hypothetical protein
MSTRKFRKIYSAVISLIILTACSPFAYKSSGVHGSVANSLSVITLTENKATKLKTEITFSQAQISGISIIKSHGDTISGAFVTEFGLKGFEFNLYNNRCRVFNLMSKLDKWYIRKTLENDILMIFNRYQSTNINYISGKQYELKTDKNKILSISRTEHKKNTGFLIFENDSVFLMQNIKLNIKYNFQRLENN